jgi:hypothetical protein
MKIMAVSGTYGHLGDERCAPSTSGVAAFDSSSNTAEQSSAFDARDAGC